MTERHLSPGQRTLIDLGPLVVFFCANYIYGIMVGTAALMFATVVVICITLFFGIGFGLFGQIDRWMQVIIVLLIWILQLIWSKPWLEKFRFGPLEWLWRSFTYGKKQKMIR